MYVQKAFMKILTQVWTLKIFKTHAGKNSLRTFIKLSRVCQSLTHSIYYNVTIWSLNLLQLAKVQHTAMLDQFINGKYEFYCKVQTSKVLWLPMFVFFGDLTRDEQKQLIISSLEGCGIAQKKCPSTEHMQITVLQHWSETDTQARCERKAYNAIHPPAIHTKEWEPRKPCPSAIHQMVHNGLNFLNRSWGRFCHSGRNSSKCVLN